MKKNTKTTLLLTTLLLTVFASSMGTANALPGTGGAAGFDFTNLSPEELENMPAGLSAGLGGVFSMFDQFGPSGAALGQLFELLLGDIVNLSSQATEIPHVYVLNASSSQTYERTVVIDEEPEINYLLRNLFPDKPGQYPYLETERTGNYTVTYESGASVVMVIWDNDDSFITALQKIIDAVHNTMKIFEEMGDAGDWTEQEQQRAITQIIGYILDAITYLLIHINDIINGDELITANIITWESTSVSYSDDFLIKKTFKWGDNDGDFENDEEIDPTNVSAAFSALNDLGYGNNRLSWLLEDAPDLAGVQKEWGKFTFNLIEVWLKNFEIHINAAAIINMLLEGSSDPGPASASPAGPFGGISVHEIFQGLDIDIYLMTHSLKGFIAYNDSDGNGVPSVQHTRINDTTATGDVVQSDIITNSEAKYWFAMGSLGEVVWNEPELNSEGTGISWSIRFNNPELIAIPIGLSPEDAALIAEELEFIEMGFTFTPNLEEIVETEGYSLETTTEEVTLAAGIVKLDQYFGQWNEGGGPNNPDLAGMDFAVIFISTMVHFHVNFEVDPLSSEDLAAEELYEQRGLLEDGRYVATSQNRHGVIKVGRETGDLPVAHVDIAGPEYIQGEGATAEAYNASTVLLPIAFMGFEAEANAKFVDARAPEQSFEASGFLELQASVMIYAVNYPSFDGSGDQIWHDPTFSVFMTWDNPGFWAVILVVGSVTLVAVAAIMITKRKNRF